MEYKNQGLNYNSLARPWFYISLTITRLIAVFYKKTEFQIKINDKKCKTLLTSENICLIVKIRGDKYVWICLKN